MIEQTTLLLFLATVTVFIVTPGPNMIFCVARSIIAGPKAGILSLVGVCIGLAVHATAAGLGLSKLFTYFPIGYDILKAGGAIYLLWLAWHTYRSPDGLADEFDFQSADPSAYRHRSFVFIAQGALNALLSPKAVFFYLVLFPQFLNPEQGSILAQSLVLISIINVINFCVIAGLCIAAGRTREWLAGNPRVIALQRKIVSVVFVGLALRVVTTRTPA